ncbi:MAG: hypothetical protein ACR2NP_12365, partial [Pirellulaceae bacterium]
RSLDSVRRNGTRNPERGARMQSTGFSITRHMVTCGVTAVVASLLINANHALALQQSGLPPIRPATMPQSPRSFSPPPQAPSSLGDMPTNDIDPFSPEHATHQHGSHQHGSHQQAAQQQAAQQQALPQPATGRFGNLESNNLRGSLLPAANHQSTTPQSLQPSSRQAAGQLPQPYRGATSRPANQAAIVDSALQPAAFNSAPTSPRESRPANPTVSQQQIELAQHLLDQLTATNAVPGEESQPMELLDMLANSSTGKQMELVQQYWKTWGAWANYQFVRNELQWLQQMGQPRSETSRLLVDAARSAVRDEVAARRIELTAQRQRLNEFLLGPQSELLPLPVDTPLLKGYRTNFDVYAAERSMPDRLRSIDRLLPDQHQLIADRAATVQRCRNVVIQATRTYSQGAEPAASLLQAIHLCRTNHDEFVDTVVDYNLTIAEYAMDVKPFNTAPEQVVAMLIPVQATAMPESPADNGLRQATLPNTYMGQGQSVAPQYPLAPSNPATPYPGTPQTYPSGGAATAPPSLGNGGFNNGSLNNGGSQGFQPASSAGSGGFRR